MHANHREDIDAIGAGDIAAAVGLTDTRTGDTLCDEKHPILLENIIFPEPVISQAIEPKTKADQDKLGIALTRLAQEDPTFRMRTDEETQQTIIAGMGELHLEIIIDRLMREFKVDANQGKPQVAYKEAITKTVEKQGKFIRQTGGKGQYGDVWIRLEPGEPGTGYVFEWKIVGGAVPKEYSKAVQEGSARLPSPACSRATPSSTSRRRRFDGSYHDVDSSEMAFKIAGSMAFKEANRAAGPILLEPIMGVEVTAPRDYMGAVNGDLMRRRGQIQSQDEAIGGAVVIKANVPLCEMFGYATDLRSATQGRATYTMEFARYEKAPKSVEEEIVAKAQGKTLRLPTTPKRRPLRYSPHVKRPETGCAEARARKPRPKRKSMAKANSSGRSRTSTSAPPGTSTTARRRLRRRSSIAWRPRTRTSRSGTSTTSTTRPKRRSAALRSPSRTKSTRRRSATTRTSTAPVTPTTSRT